MSRYAPIPSGTCRRALPLLIVAPLMMLTTPASAHVEVEADDQSPGAHGVTVTFHVPNEQAPATTVGIRILLPAAHPLLGVRAAPQHGFAATVKTGPRGVASEVDFTGGHIRGEDELAFAVSVGQLPNDASTLTFKTLQIYSTGAVVRWIETAADGAPEPEHPAPVLSLVPGAGTAATAGPRVTAAAAAQPASADDTNGSLPIVVLGLLVAVALAATAALAWIARTRRALRKDRRVALGALTSRDPADKH